MAADLKRAVAQFLSTMTTSGVTHLPRVTPAPPPTRKPGPGSRPVRSDKSPSRMLSGLTSADQNPIMPPEKDPEVVRICGQKLKSKKQKSTALSELAAVVSQCTRCQELATTRKQTVFGVGDPDARIMFIGEAPGADEDKQGEPFVGRAGQLMTKIIEACTLTREEVYICNILRCRPPGNRNPLPAESANCREYLDAQISVVKPEYIICWGTVAAQNLLSEKRAVGKLRGQFFDYGSARVLCTYHPSYLLRNPAAKKFVWDDMKLFMKELGVTLK